MSFKRLLDENPDVLEKLMKDPVAFTSYLIGVEPFSYQTKFLRDNSSRIVVCAGRQIGKSFMASARALWFAVTHDKTTTLIVSSTLRQSMLMFDKIIELTDSSKLVKRAVVYQSRTRMKFTNGSWIIALPCGRTGSTLRGFTAHQIIIDETAFVPEQVITEVVLPMLATTSGTAILLSTPYDRDHIFFKVFNSGFWSRYQLPSSCNPLIKPEFLEEQKELVGEERFRREYLAEFVEDEKAYFPMALLRSCVHVCPADGSFCAFCAAFGGTEAPSGLLYGGYDPGGSIDPAAFVEVSVPKGTPRERAPIRCLLYRKYLRKEKKVEQEEEQDENLYTRFTVQISDLHNSEKWKMQRMLVDTQGIGKPIVEHCKSLKLPAEGLPMTLRNKETVLSHLRMKLEQKLIELPNDLELLANLNCIQAERTRSGGYVFGHPRGTHDDLAYALALAVYAATGKPPPIVIMMTNNDQGGRQIVI
ncbi:MAG TPA: terminase family protein [Nitrososphaerales archaeon]|nr:terminase family protein [Nitrososphaerales archaeon]